MSLLVEPLWGLEEVRMCTRSISIANGPHFHSSAGSSEMALETAVAEESLAAPRCPPHWGRRTSRFPSYPDKGRPQHRPTPLGIHMERTHVRTKAMTPIEEHAYID